MLRPSLRAPPTLPEEGCVCALEFVMHLLLAVVLQAELQVCACVCWHLLVYMIVFVSISECPANKFQLWSREHCHVMYVCEGFVISTALMRANSPKQVLHPSVPISSNHSTFVSGTCLQLDACIPGFVSQRVYVYVCAQANTGEERV